jgi:ketosteroid isomerase-like protein
MTKTKLVLYLMGASMALALQSAPAFATTVHSPDEAAVKAVTEKFATDLAKGDLKAISLLYTGDAKLLPPNEAAISGRAAILAYFEKNLRPDLVTRAKFSHYEIYGSGDAATSISELEMYDGKGHIVERGRQTIVLIKQGGEWKIHRDMWSDNTPLEACN